MPNKRLGQHWLKDRLILEAIADSTPLSSSDTVLEIGPGLGTLTSSILRRVSSVLAVEYDSELARKLPGQFPGKNLQVINADILQFDFSQLPEGYKVVANVPYYITQKIIEHFLTSSNRPQSMALLVQKEVAEKLCAQPGDMTAIATKLQYIYNVQLGTRVQKEYFIPPPKVDSQVIVCTKRDVAEYAQSDFMRFTRVVDAGYSSPRKKLRSTLSGGLSITKDEAEQICNAADIDPESRASAVSVNQWIMAMKAYDKG